MKNFLLIALILCVVGCNDTRQKFDQEQTVYVVAKKDNITIYKTYDNFGNVLYFSSTGAMAR